MKLSDLFSHWEQVHTDTLATVDSFDDVELHFTPYEESWPAGQIMLHIAEAEDGWLRCVVKREQQEWPAYPLAQYPTVTAIRAVLSQVHARTASYLATALPRSQLPSPFPTPWFLPRILFKIGPFVAGDPG